MASLIRSLDWSSTPLGPTESWPQSLRTTVSLCLASNFPINIVWGPQHTQIYNDGYRVVCGDRHPAALGMDYTQCWASAWPAIGQPFDRALEGDTSFLENQRMFLFRNGYLEETFFTFSLSPIRDETGKIGGLFHPVTETTSTMVGERRTRALRDLTSSLSEAESTAEVYRLTIETLSAFDLDLPFVVLYQLDHENRTYHLAGFTGVEQDSCLNPDTLPVDRAGIWPMGHLRDQAGAAQVSGIRARIETASCGPYEEAPDVAFAMPIRQPGMDLPVALLMAGASSRLPLNDVYRGFFDLTAAAFNAALTRVIAAEKEHKRLEMLAAIDRAKTVFFSNVSHEFRTPLTLMLGPLEEALEAEGMPAAQRERLQIANRNAQRLLKMVNSLLDFSRIEAGRNDASFAPTDLSALTLDLASNFRAACERAGLTLTVECVPLRMPVYVDREMWEKIVLNLLSNAFKFTLQGGIKLSLREHADGIELAVADTGVGIPSAELPRIFDRFHRVEGQRGRSMEGTGIGLSLVRELVQLHGGTIAADSALGQGTVFKLGIPFGTDHLPAEQVHAASNAAVHPGRGNAYVEEALRWLPANDRALVQHDAPAPEKPADKPRIVLADDNADMRAYIQRILEEGGYAVEAVGNGTAALAAIKSGTLPELVLSDVMMPELDGFALLQALRTDAATQGLMVILLSARAGEEARLEGLAAGADDYLVKPFSARELRARIDGAITLARQRRQAAAREQALLIEIEINAERGRAALRESEAHVASLFEQTTAGIAEADFAGRLIRVNERYCQIMGRHRDELIGQHMHAFIHPDDLQQNPRLLDNLTRAGTPFEIDNRYQRSDGTAVWVSKAATPIRIDGDKAADSILAVALDITERKQVEEELRQANRRKDEFLAMLAHELRNPLAPISAAAELMGIVKLDEAQLKQTSEVITRQVRHMTSLVDDLLDVSRVNSGLIILTKSPHEIKSIVSNAVEQVRPLIQARRHRLATDLAPESGHVLADQKRLVQILTNLLNNAAKYTPEGGNLTLRTEVLDEHIVMSVQDNGIGIAPELQSRVFELFSQAECTSDRSQGGLGLGLALVQSLVELHGGKVTCFSEGLGKGSCFTVTLPRTREQDGLTDRQQNYKNSLKENKKLRILVVDDNVDAAQMLAMLLQASGHEVLVEHGSLRAIERARIDLPDVCVLDIGLPDVDGNELARRLRIQPETGRATLIAVTGYGQEHDRKNAFAAGFDHHLVKPVDAAKLISILARIGAS